jgi:hypothetical protein
MQNQFLKQIGILFILTMALSVTGCIYKKTSSNLSEQTTLDPATLEETPSRTIVKPSHQKKSSFATTENTKSDSLSEQTTLDPATLEETPTPATVQSILSNQSSLTPKNINPATLSWQLLSATNCFLQYPVSKSSSDAPVFCAANTPCTTQNRKQIREDILPFVLILRTVQMNLFFPPPTTGDNKVLYDTFRASYGAYLDDFYKAEQPADIDMDKYYPLDQCVRAAFNQPMNTQQPQLEI